MMKLKIFIGISILLTACAPQVTANAEKTEAVVPVETEAPPISTATIALEPTVPSPTPQPLLLPPQPEEISLENISDFSMLPDNLAQGESAPDFSARLLGGGDFKLSENRGVYWLVLPTALGCGPCMYNLNSLEQVISESETSSNLHVLVLNISQNDQPEYWQGYADSFGNSSYRWSVLSTSTFLDDYDIYGLGSFLIVDPSGTLVYKSGNSPRVEYIAHMFTLAQQQGVD